MKNLFPDEEKELKDICHSMAYGDDSEKTMIRYMELMGIEVTEESVRLATEEMRE